MYYNTLINPFKNQFIDINSIQSKYLLNKYLQKGGSAVLKPQLVTAVSSQTDDGLNLQNLLDLIQTQLNLFDSNNNEELNLLFFNNPLIKTQIDLLKKNLLEIKKEEEEIQLIENVDEDEAAQFIIDAHIDLKDSDLKLLKDASVLRYLKLEKMKEIIKIHLGYSLQEIQIDNTMIDEKVNEIVIKYIDSSEITELISSDEFQKSFFENIEVIIQNPSIFKNPTKIYISTEDDIEEILENELESPEKPGALSRMRAKTKLDLESDLLESRLLSRFDIELGGGFNRIYLQKGNGIKNWIKNAAKVTMTVGLAIGIAAALTVAMPVYWAQ